MDMHVAWKSYPIYQPAYICYHTIIIQPDIGM